jgi:hypothetical protein
MTRYDPTDFEWKVIHVWTAPYEQGISTAFRRLGQVHSCVRPVARGASPLAMPLPGGVRMELPTVQPLMENAMTTSDKVARRKATLLQLAADLLNVPKACKVFGYSRQQLYEIRGNYQVYGTEGLIDRLPGLRLPHPNRVAGDLPPANSSSLR